MTTGRSSARTRLGALALVATVALAPAGLAGCADDGTSSTPTTVGAGAAGANEALPPIDEAQALPPIDVTTMRRFYEPLLAPMGLELTRVALIDRSDGGYDPSPSGTHLALYVEPTRPFTDDEFVANLWDLTAAVTPDVFARWSGVESYDICQEPNPGEDDRPEPFPVTQIDLTRQAAAQVDWGAGDLTDLLVASRTVPDFLVRVKRTLRENPTYVAAAEAADAEIEASGLTVVTPSTVTRGTFPTDPTPGD
jgi:hypothetical protein